ncbi:ABC transporter permease [Campylobacterota bacterium]|nr:ABC transporter permease [Campylobacterota bacterium]
MFYQMIKGAFTRQKSKFLLIALTIGLGVCVASAMLNIMLDIGDKVNKELKSYGANITVRPKFASILSDVYNDTDQQTEQFIDESDVIKVKTIFWAHNIVDFAPFLTHIAAINNEQFSITGTWFNKEILLPDGETITTGIAGLKSWWQIEGEWAKDDAENEIMIGLEVAKKLKLSAGDQLAINGQTYKISAVFSALGNEDNEIFMPLAAVQNLSGNVGKISYIDLSALTAPENELARKAAQDPQNLSLDEWETWYCTAYISSIAYQIEEALPNARAKAVLQISQSEGAILGKVQLLMLLLTALTLLCSALGISNLVTAFVMEKSAEIGLIKAIGALDGEVIALILTAVLCAAACGSVAGYLVGLQLASFIGRVVFDAVIEPNALAAAAVLLLVLIVVFLGSIPALKMVLLTRPADVLRG